MYFLGRTQMIPDADYEQAVQRIMEKGFDGVEINIYDREFNLREEFYAPDFPRQMKAILNRYGVQHYSIGAHHDYTESQEVMDRMKQTIGVAKEIGAPLVIITGPFRNPDIPVAEQWALQIEKAKELCAEAERQGIYLAMEYEPGFVIDNTDKMLQAFAEIASPTLKVNADIGHFFLQDSEPLQALTRCKDYIIHAHIDNMKGGVHDHLPPYEGDMDLQAYFNTLRAGGFDGLASIDVYNSDYEAIASKSLEFLRKL